MDIRNQVFIHYGSTQFIPEKVLPVVNDVVPRPKGKLHYSPIKLHDGRTGMKSSSGGFWASSTTAKHGWRDWCKREGVNIGSEYFTFSIKPEYIDDILVVTGQDLSKYKFAYHLDFDKIQEDRYNAIWLTDKGFKPGNYQLEFQYWDCESLFVLDPRIVHAYK